MSLNWNLSKIRDHDNFCWRKVMVDGVEEDRMNPVTDALIWTTMGIGMGEITQANHLEFFGRCQLISKLCGPPLHKLENGKPVGVDFTIEDIVRHIGLSTNVFPMEKRGTFAKRVGEAFLRDEMRRAEKAQAEAAKAE